MRVVWGWGSGGVARAALDHRLMALNPPGLLGGVGHPGGMAAISRVVREERAQPPVTRWKRIDPGRGRSRISVTLKMRIAFGQEIRSLRAPRGLKSVCMLGSIPPGGGSEMRK